MPETTKLGARAIRQAIIIALLALLDLRIILNILAGQRYPGAAELFALLWALMLTMFVGVSVYAEIVKWRAERSLRAVLSGDTTAVPPAQEQPDLAQSLQPGETLTLTRMTRPRAFWLQLLIAVCLAPIGLVMFAYIGELCIYLAMPSVLAWLAPFLADPNPASLPTPPADLSLLQWAAFLLPCCLVALAAGLLLLEPFVGRRQDIIASDAGLAIRRSLQRRRFIPWSDILLILHSNEGDERGAVYWLCARRRSASLAFRIITPSLTPSGRPRRSRYAYSGGPEAYLAGVKQLAATLTARAHTSMRPWPPSLPSATGQSAASVYDDIHALDQALALPLADAHLQPTPAETEQARAFTDKRLILRDRIPFRTLAPQIRMNAIGFILTMSVIAVIQLLGGYVRRGPAPPLTLSTALYVLFALALAATGAVFLAAASYRNEVSPTVAATNDGLALLKFNELPRQRVAWEDIRAWAILAPAPGEADPAGCVIWTEEQTLEWREPPDAQLAGRAVHGDRRAAYRAAARQLHALIAARTALPLRAIPPRPSA